MITDREIMDEGAKRWMYKYAKKNYWRIASWYEFEDLVSDGYFCYYYVIRKYPTAVDRPHIMRLFQLTFRSQIEDLANGRTKQVDDAASDVIERISIEDVEAATLASLIAKAPPQIKSVLELFTTPWGLEQLRSPYEAVDGHKETFNERLCRLTGVKGVNLANAVKDYFATT